MITTTYLLDDLFDCVNGGAWNESEYVADGIHVVKVTNMIDGTIKQKDDNYLPLNKYETYKKHELFSGDIVVATVGSHPTQQGSVVGRTSLIPTNFAGSFLNQNAVCLRVKNIELVFPKYFYYVTKTIFFKHHIESRAKGSANQVRMAIGDLKRFKYEYPLLKIQKKIAAILSSYDDLIENNQRRIAILENMAEEIYREWFVRFRFPGYQSTEFEKGIPKGWKEIAIGKICEFDKGKNPEIVTEVSDEDMLLYINVEALTGEGTSYAKKQKNSVLCQIDDILMLMDGSRSGLVFRANNHGIVGSTLSVIRIEKNLKNFVYEYLKAMKEAIVFNNTGSAIPHANKEYINRMIVYIPKDESIILQFNEIYDMFYTQINNLRQQNSQLENTKKMLLPRLISGILSVENLDILFPPSMIEDGAA